MVKNSEKYYSQLLLDTINYNILIIDGSCPVGTGPGEWSNGEGECCCDLTEEEVEEFGEDKAVEKSKKEIVSGAKTGKLLN